MADFVTLGGCGCPCGPVPCITSCSYILEAPIECGKQPFTTGGPDGVYRVHRVAWTNQFGSFARTHTYSSGSATICEVTTSGDVATDENFQPPSSGGSSSVSVTELTPAHKVTRYYNFSGFNYQTVTETLSDFTDEFEPAKRFAWLGEIAFEYDLALLAVGEHVLIQLDYDGNEGSRLALGGGAPGDNAYYEDRFPGKLYRKTRVFVSVELSQETCCYCEFDGAIDIVGNSMKTPECFQSNHRRVGSEIVCDPLLASLVIDIVPIHIQAALYVREVGRYSPTLINTPPCCINETP